MKKGIKSLMLIAAAAMTFASCQKEDKAQVNNGEGTVKVNFTSVADGTKTYFGDRITDKYPTLWEGTEQVGITYLDANIDKENNVVGVKGEGETTTFSTELAAPSSKEGSILVFSPWYSGNYTDEDAGGFTNYVSQYTDANVVIPKKQFSTPNSCDPRAQLLVAKCNFDNGVASNVDVNFKHVTAYGKIAIKGVDAKIKTVEIDFGQNVTGTGFYYYTAGDNEGKIIENPRATNYNKSSVVIDNSNNKCDKTFWFGIPAISCEGKTVVVTVTDENDKEYTKAITSESKILKFEQGKISSFTVTVAPKSEEKTYTTVANLRAKGANATISEQVYMKATVISNNEGGNSTSLKNIVVSDGEAGITVRFKSNANTEWKVGTELEFDLMGASLSAYNGCLQLNNFDNAKAVATGNVNKLAPKTISAADLVTGKYESMYVAIPDVQVVNDDLSKTVGGSSHTSINMEAKTGEKFVMFTASYAVFKEDQVPQGCGTLMGIANINNDTYQVMPTIASDYAGLTGTRFGDAPALEFKTPTFTATTFKEGVEIVNGKIILTYKNASREKIKVEGTASGEAASGVGVATTSDQLGEGDGTIELSVFGTPAKAGAVTFNITVTKAGETEPLYTGSVDATVASASSTETSYTVDFAAQGYKRGDIMTDKNDGNLTFGDYTIVFAKNKGANPPTYYCPETGVTDNTQAAVRMYPQNTMTIKSNKTIVKMVINAYSGNANNPTVTVNTGAYTLNSTTTPGDTEWTGSAKEITFTIGGKKNYRISSIKIYTE